MLGLLSPAQQLLDRKQDRKVRFGKYWLHASPLPCHSNKSRDYGEGRKTHQRLDKIQ